MFARKVPVVISETIIIINLERERREFMWSLPVELLISSSEGSWIKGSSAAYPEPPLFIRTLMTSCVRRDCRNQGVQKDRLLLILPR